MNDIDFRFNTNIKGGRKNLFHEEKGLKTEVRSPTTAEVLPDCCHTFG